MNSGLFWLKANVRTIGLMERIAARLAKEEAWDQSVYNQEIFFLSHDEYESPHVSVRVMNIYRWVLHSWACQTRDAFQEWACSVLAVADGAGWLHMTAVPFWPDWLAPDNL